MAVIHHHNCGASTSTGGVIPAEDTTVLNIALFRLLDRRFGHGVENEQNWACFMALAGCGVDISAVVLVYLERLHMKKPAFIEKISGAGLYRLLCTSAMVACKFNQDEPAGNKIFAQNSGIPVLVLNQMERHFLKAMDYSFGSSRTLLLDASNRILGAISDATRVPLTMMTPQVQWPTTTAAAHCFAHPPTTTGVTIRWDALHGYIHHHHHTTDTLPTTAAMERWHVESDVETEYEADIDLYVPPPASQSLPTFRGDDDNEWTPCRQFTLARGTRLGRIHQRPPPTLYKSYPSSKTYVTAVRSRCNAQHRIACVGFCDGFTRNCPATAQRIPVF